MITGSLIILLIVVISICLAYINNLTTFKYTYSDKCYDCKNDCYSFQKENIKKPEKKKKRKIKIVFK